MQFIGDIDERGLRICSNKFLGNVELGDVFHRFPFGVDHLPFGAIEHRGPLCGRLRNVAIVPIRFGTC